MAFGQASGPPASAKEIERLAVLFGEAGFASFREARYPFGLTQRQASGKFTRDEVTALIERLEAETADSSVEDRQDAAVAVAVERLRQEQAELVAGLPGTLLAEELERRGWACIPPS